MSRNHIRHVVIAGGGTAGWMTAAAFANQSTRARTCDVTLIESDRIGAVGVGEATVPPIRIFHRLLGIDEAELMREVSATFKLGIRFEDWLRPGHSYFHPFGKLGAHLPGDLVPFHHYWLRGRGLEEGGGESDLCDYSLSAQMASAGKFAAASADPASILSNMHYAYHLDAGLYAAYLRRYAERRGVSRMEGEIADVALRSGDGFIDAVTLADGRRIAADFYVDCTGFAGVLIERVLGVGFEDWSHLLPCDRAVAVQAANRGPLPPFTRAIAREHGWQWRIPLQHRSGNGYVYRSGNCSDDEATALLLDKLESEPLTEPKRLRFLPGRRRKFWSRNCVAIGLSAGLLEPLESTGIHLMQDSILRLMAMFPHADCERMKIDEFNRLTEIMYDEVRDLLILHYHANERDNSFWDAARNMRMPDTLRNRMDLFRSFGHMDSGDALLSGAASGRLFSTTSWLAVMIGQNIVPRACHPFAEARDSEQLAQALAGLKTAIRQAVEGMPSHDEYVARYCKAEERRSGRA